MSRTIISIVGGQSDNIVTGIKQFQPLKILFITTEQSKQTEQAIRTRLKEDMPWIYYYELTDLIGTPYIPTDASIFETAKKIASSIKDDEIIVDITGGPKHIAIAFYDAFIHNHKATIISNFATSLETFDLTNKRIFNKFSHDYDIGKLITTKAPGTIIKNHYDFNMFTDNDLKLCHEIFEIRGNNLFQQNCFRRLTNAPECSAAVIKGGKVIDPQNKNNYILFSNPQDVQLQSVTFHVELKNRCLDRTIQSEHANQLVHRFAWFELYIAAAINKSWQPDLMWLSVEINNESTQNTLNEIDIILCKDGKYGFIECKTSISDFDKGTELDKSANNIKKYGGSAVIGVYIQQTEIAPDVKKRCMDSQVHTFSIQEAKGKSSKKWYEQLASMLTNWYKDGTI